MHEILLHSGSYFDFLFPELNEIKIEDIAHGLSMTCRFVGQCNRFYSVAEHSVYVSHLVPEEHAMAALLHDSSEAFLGDVSKPLKNLLSEYMMIEESVERAIFKQYNIPFPLPTCVKEADTIMLVTEQHQVMDNVDEWVTTLGFKPADINISCWSPDQAKTFFLDRYYELTLIEANHG